ncbi:MAG: autotransporter-associated beta strand repeat-containing protein [Hyphomicrobiales bacterium]|nr:autotransporter-associated beta strand repeat-containing protein [Hyphomicrobiales bacterium]
MGASQNVWSKRGSAYSLTLALLSTACFMGVARAQTLDLNGVDATLPRLPYFTNAWLSGSANITNNGAAGANVIEGGGTAANGLYSGSITDGTSSTGLTQTGGVTILSGANAYSGATNVNAGTLQAGSATGLSANSVFNLASGATLDLNGQNASIAGLGGYGQVVNARTGAGSTLTVGANGTSSTYYGTLADGAATATLALTKDGGGVLTLANNAPYSSPGASNAYSGPTTIRAGALQLGDGYNIGTLGSGAVAISSGATLQFNQGVDFTSGPALPGKMFANAISGAGGVLQMGPGTVTLSGANSYTGGTVVDGSSNTFSQLLFASPAALPSTGSVLLTNGGVAGTTFAIDSGGFLNKIDRASVGAVALGANTTDTEGSLSFFNLPNVALGAASSNCDASAFCATMTYVGYLIRPYVNDGGAGAYQFGGGNAILDVATNLGDTYNPSGTALTTALVQGAQTVSSYTMLSGDNSYSGGTQISSGILQFQSAKAIPNAGTPSIVISPYAVAAAGYAIDQTFLNSIVGAASQGAAALAVDSSNNLNFNAPGLTSVSLGAVGQVSFSGRILPSTDRTGLGTFNLGGGAIPGNSSIYSRLTVAAPLTDLNASRNGHNQLIVNPAAYTNGIDVYLTAANTYTGQTWIQGGALWLGDGVNLGTIANTSQVIADAPLNFNEPSAIVFDRSVSGSSGVAQYGPGAVTLTGNLTYTGGTYVFGGVLALGPGASLANSAFVDLLSFGTPETFDISKASGNQTVQGLIGDASASLVLGANSLTIGTPGQAYPTSFGQSGFAGVISGTGGVTFQGSDIYTLSGANTYSGATNVLAGTLQAGATNTFSPNSTFMIAGGATLDLNGFSQQLAGLTSSGSTALVTNNATTAATLTVGLNNVSSAFSGVIQDGAGALALTKTGVGSLQLGGSATYSGATNVLAGALVGASANAFSANSAMFVAAGATLDVGSTSQTVASLTGAAGSVVNTSCECTSVLTFGRDNASTTFAGLLSDRGGTLALVKQGSGVFTIAGANKFSGGLTIQSGEVVVLNGGGLGSGDVSMFDNTTLAFRGTFVVPNNIRFVATDPTIDSGTGVVTQTGVISGPGALTKIGSGTYILNAANTYTGNTLVSAGTLEVDGSIAPSPLTTVASGATISGTGVVGALTVQSGGTVTTGASASPYATLSATGPILLQSGATYLVNVSPAAASLLTTTGTASISGAGVTVALAAGAYNAAQKYTILTAARGLTGVFSSATIVNNTVYRGVLSYDANDAFLQIVPVQGDNSLNDISALMSTQSLANQRVGMMVTNRVLASILGGFNEQINCASCMSAFGALGSISAGFHGRKALNDNLSLLGGIAYVAYDRGGVRTDATPMFAAALRYDWVELGSSRPYVEFGGVLTPRQRMRFSRDYANSGSAAAGQGATNAGNYSVFGKLGWVYRFSERDEFSGAFELARMWQYVGGYVETPSPTNPVPAVMLPGTDRMNIAKIGAQWIHLFGSTVETQVNLGVARSFGTKSGAAADYSLGAGAAVQNAQVVNATWLEYGLRVGYRVRKNVVIDVFTDGTLGGKPIGNTIHGGAGVRYLF